MAMEGSRDQARQIPGAGLGAVEYSGREIQEISQDGGRERKRLLLSIENQTALLRNLGANLQDQGRRDRQTRRLAKEPQAHRPEETARCPTDQVLGWKVRRDGTREPIHAAAKPFKTFQLVVLVNEGTASAAEILAAGLRDTAGARLVGAKTYGRGQIQTYVALNESAGMVIPAANAESAHGIRFNKGSGLSSDVVVSSTREKTNVDAVYERAGLLLTHD